MDIAHAFMAVLHHYLHMMFVLVTAFRKQKRFFEYSSFKVWNHNFHIYPILLGFCYFIIYGIPCETVSHGRSNL